MIKYLRYIITFFIIFLISSELMPQAPKGEFTDFSVLPNKDTLLYKRKYGSWWAGITASALGGIHTGSIKFSDYAGDRNLSVSPLFQTGFGFGAIGEWVPPEKTWGAALRVLAAEYRNGSVTQNFKEYESDYEVSFVNTYLTISPMARYNLPTENLFLLGGFDIDLLLKEKVDTYEKLNYSHEPKNQFTNKIAFEKFRAGLMLGIGYDFFVANINHKARIRFSPTLTISYGLPVIKYSGSDMSAISARLGVSIKLGPDQYTVEKILFDSTSIKPMPVLSMSTPNRYKVKLPLYAAAKPITGELAFVEKPLIAEQLKKEVPKTFAELKLDKVKFPEINYPDIPAPKEIAEFVVPKEGKVILPFQSKLPRNIIDSLDKIAKFLKTHNGYTLNVIGFSDDHGTPDENFNNSVQRSQAVKNYLVSKKIPGNIIYSRGNGSLTPIVNNRNRDYYKNNRVVIEIVPPKKKDAKKDKEIKKEKDNKKK